jgi:SAM-dependent methyltransferase
MNDSGRSEPDGRKGIIQGHDRIREAYRDETVASEYVRERFREPLGALLHARQCARMREVIRRLQPERVLEIAPGPGRLTVDIAPTLRRKPIIVDASLQMLAEARARLTAAGQPGCRLIQGDAFALPLSGPFDLVYSFRLIRHFDDADRSRLYQQIAGLLRPKGVLVFDAVNEVVSRPLRERAGKACSHYDALSTPVGLAAELDREGFTLLRIDGVQHNFPLLYQLQVHVAARIRWVGAVAMEIVDRIPGGEPLEWVVTCERR